MLDYAGSTHGDEGIRTNVPSHSNQARRCLLAVAIASVTLAGGCTSMQPLRTTPDAVRAQLRAGTLLKAGDEVTVHTANAAPVTMRFERIEGDRIVGRVDDPPPAPPGPRTTPAAPGRGTPDVRTDTATPPTHEVALPIDQVDAVDTQQYDRRRTVRNTAIGSGITLTVLGIIAIIVLAAGVTVGLSGG